MQWPEGQTMQWPKEGQTMQWPKEEGQTMQWPKEGQTIQWPKEEGQTIQWPKGQTAIYKTLHRKLKTEQHKPTLKTEGELVFSRRVSSSCSTCDIRRLSLVINSMMKNVSHECGNNRIVTNEKHRYSVIINQIMMATVKLR